MLLLRKHCSLLQVKTFLAYGTWTCFPKSDTGGHYIPNVMVGEAQVSADQKGVAGCGIETGDFGGQVQNGSDFSASL